MDEEKIQIIDPSPIVLVAKRVNSVGFDGGPIDSGGKDVKAQFNINNRITGRGEVEGGQEAIFATLDLSVEPEEGFNFYSLNLSVTGLFARSHPDVSEDDFERAVLTDGMTELYSYARSVADALTRDGVFGAVMFPLLRIDI